MRTNSATLIGCHFHHSFLIGRGFFRDSLREHASFGAFTGNLNFFGHSSMANQFGLFSFIALVVVAEQAAAAAAAGQTESGCGK